MKFKRFIFKREFRFALLAALLALSLLEAFLRLIGVAPSPDREFSLANNQNPTEPVWVAEQLDSAGEPFYVSAVDQHSRPFPVTKAPHTFRIVAMGGSATHGFGMSENGAFSHRLWQLLSPLEPERDLQVLNFGTIAWASQQELWLTKKVLETVRPDLLILYIGNNELLEAATIRRFLSPSHVSRWMNRVRAEQTLSQFHTFLLLRKTLRPFVAGSEEGKKVLSSLAVLPEEDRAQLGTRARRFAADCFTHHLRRIVEVSRAAGVPVLLSTAAVNLRDPPITYPPPPDVAVQWQQLMAEGAALEGELKNRQARALYEQALEVWESAEGYWRLARVLEGLKEKDAAYAAYAKARDFSQNPSRAVSEVQEATRDVADELDLPLFDAELAFRKAAADGIPAFDLFYDYCHPTVKGHWLLAAGLAKTILREGLYGTSAEAPDFEAIAARWLEAFAVRHDDFLRVDEWLGISWNPAPVYHPDSRDAMKAVYVAMKDAAQRGGAVERVLYGNSAYHTAQRIGPSHVGGTLEEARMAWQQALELDPTLCIAHANQGYLFASIGRYEEAAQAYADAATCQPASTEWSRLSKWAKRQLEP